MTPLFISASAENVKKNVDKRKSTPIHIVGIDRITTHANAILLHYWYFNST